MKCAMTAACRGLCLVAVLTTTFAAHSAAFGAGEQQTPAAAGQAGDIALQPNGELRGQIVNRQGRPVAMTQVAVIQNQKLVARAKADMTGRFAVAGLRPGVYEIHSAAGIKSVRLWAPQTAPPASQQAMLLISDGQTARAQFDYRAYRPAIRGAIAGGLVTGLTYWALDYNADDAS